MNYGPTYKKEQENIFLLNFCRTIKKFYGTDAQLLILHNLYSDYFRILINYPFLRINLYQNVKDFFFIRSYWILKVYHVHVNVMVKRSVFLENQRKTLISVEYIGFSDFTIPRILILSFSFQDSCFSMKPGHSVLLIIAHLLISFTGTKTISLSLPLVFRCFPIGPYVLDVSYPKTSMTNLVGKTSVLYL